MLGASTANRQRMDRTISDRSSYPCLHCREEPSYLLDSQRYSAQAHEEVIRSDRLNATILIGESSSHQGKATCLMGPQRPQKRKPAGTPPPSEHFSNRGTVFL